MTDLEREAAADVAVRALVSGTRRAPPLWALFDEGPIEVHSCDDCHRSASAPAGWTLVVDADGRSR